MSNKTRPVRPAVKRVEEMFVEKDYDDPMGISMEDRLNGVTATARR